MITFLFLKFYFEAQRRLLSENLLFVQTIQKVHSKILLDSNELQIEFLNLDLFLTNIHNV